MEAVICEIAHVKENYDKPMVYNYGNGHGAHLLRLLMTWTSDGNAVSNVEKCMNELLEELSKVDKEKVVDMLLEYITKNHVVTFMQKLSEWCIVPKVMDKSDSAISLDEAGVKNG